MPYTKVGPFNNGLPPAISSGNLNTIETQYDTAMADTAAKYGLDVRPWAASTAYAAGQAVVSPSGDVVTAKTAHTSGSSFSGTGSGGNWNQSATFAPTPTRGTYASRPSPGTVFTGSVYYATDVLESYVATGTAGAPATAWAVTPGGAQMGYAEITSNWSTGTTGSFVPIAGLSTTVTVGERPIVITFVGLVQSSTAADVNASIFEDGTEISRFNSTTSAASQYRTVNTSRRRGLLTPGSSHTYDARVYNQTGQSIVFASGTSAASLEVRSV